MIARELSQRTYPQIGVTEPHHAVSHHGNDPEKIAKVAKINTYHVELFAKFLEKLQAHAGWRRLAARSLAASSTAAAWAIRTSTRAIRCRCSPSAAASARATATSSCRRSTPVGNLWLSVAKRYGSDVQSMGESNGAVDFFA